MATENNKIRVKFNIFETGRKYTNKDRGYVLDNVTSVINSAAVQERVKTRQLFGYAGHTIREMAGKMALSAKTVVKLPSGQEIIADSTPGCVCTHLEIDEEGNVTHEQEVFDHTPDGKTIMALHNSKAGGFSWASTGGAKGGNTLLSDLFGFDYVPNPLNLNNNGYGLVLDSIDDNGEAEVAPSREKIIKNLKAQKVDKPGSILDSWYASEALELNKVQRENQSLKVFSYSQAQKIKELKAKSEGFGRQILDSESQSGELLSSARAELKAANDELTESKASIETITEAKEQLILDHAEEIAVIKKKHKAALREAKEDTAILDEHKVEVEIGRKYFLKEVSENSHIHIPDAVMDAFSAGDNPAVIGKFLNSLSKIKTAHLPVGEKPMDQFVLDRSYDEEDAFEGIIVPKFTM